MRDDDERVKRPVHHEIGQGLDTLSVDEIDHRIALLQDEIRRLEAARTAKQAALGAADAFFKR
ncbi:DUF1192 domain-containing protein [Methylobacterium sp. E-041]|jgi:uncharacterized small protein (DUF1192 family)|uniref:DUF1192 domain-containing protein n=1 Tax=unclassified Methylobacterium TaxID=2615210 RepID=UPI0011C9731D|nr:MULTISPECIES: DUF1192 domain-containing protein [unclassified Methylobacterium]MCJ2009291.1 DUF1192 domain-containing protein [Methylobacterium sp. J-092]MCJ2040077.1 DUF1192 domain-containing protein [Methylobacterium sp. J-059]MCJ2107751.1 DUF1192 domain-containing protein [Methylobacterium sp. E-041]TXN66949.1 DUF1192 domain-containing protein [Methylobacterium sp. WL6]